MANSSIRKEETAFIRCDDHCETLEFARTTWRDGEEWFCFSITDCYIGKREEHGLLGRFRRAWKAFWNKPVVWTQVIVTEKDRAESFFQECLDILHHDDVEKGEK